MKGKIITVAGAIANLAEAAFAYGEYPTRFTGYIPAGDREWDKIVDRYSKAFDIADGLAVPAELQKDINIFCLNAAKRKAIKEGN